MYIISKSDDTEPAPIVGSRKVTLDILARLDWTTETPKEKGTYFAVTGELIFIVEVTDVTRKGECYAIGSEVPDIFALYTHWLGPLPFPELPHKK